MILHVLNLQFEEIKRFPHLHKLIDEFVGKRLGNELEKEKDKSLEVIRFYEKYIQYLIRQDICIWDVCHKYNRSRINAEYQRQIFSYSFYNRCGSIPYLCKRERKNGEYFRERLAEKWHYEYNLGDEHHQPYNFHIKFVIIDIYCSYMSLFDNKQHRYGKMIKRNIRKDKSNKYIYDTYNVECNCKLCNR